jgi:serine protease Do
MRGLSTAGLLALAPLARPAPAPQDDASVDPRRTPIVDVIERVKPAVVSITSEIRTESWFGWSSAPSAGTGVVLFEDGYIITNNHVVEDAREIRVKFDSADDPREYVAALISTNPAEDLALIKIEGDAPFHTITLCESEPILGETVIAIGNALRHSHTVSTGIVSGLHREIKTQNGKAFQNLIQTDASINPGNSGGPLLNINGELIGINTAMQGMAENIGFAIPVAHVRKVLAEKLLALDQARAWLGFDVDENSLEVTRVVPGSPAALADIRPGDRLQALAGHLLANLEGSPSDVFRRVRLSVQPGKDVAVNVRRGARDHEVLLRAWNQIDGLIFERLGLELEVLRTGPRGVNPFLRVTSVQAGGPADEAGFEPGDILANVRSPRMRRARWFQRLVDLALEVSALPSGAAIEVEIWRDLDEDGIYHEIDVSADYSEEFRGHLIVR